MSEHYIAENGTAYSLQLETSMATPEQQRVLHDTAIDIKESVIRSYSLYIQQEALDRVAHIEDRIILMDTEHFSGFYTEWDGSDEQLAGTVFAMTTEQGDIIAFNDPAGLWQTFTDTGRQGLIEQFGDEISAKLAVKNIGTIDNLVHEVIHQFQDYSLPRKFLEIAVRYYQRLTTSDLRQGHLERPQMNDSLEVYSQLISTYGDGVHEVFFGKPTDPSLMGEIIAEAYSLAALRPSLEDITGH